MHITPLTAEWENQFWNQVTQNPLDYHFFIFDWKYKKNQSKIYLAIDESDNISGLMLIYNKHTIQIRANPQVTKQLLNLIDEKTIELTASLNSKEIIIQKYPKPKLIQEITLMQLTKGNENIQITTEPQLLDLNDAGAIAALMRNTNPLYWADFTSRALQSLFNETIWVGIKEKQNLVSLGVAGSTEGANHIMFISTAEKFRNRGYATSIVSTLVMSILKRSAIAAIFVISDNKPAIKTYSKVGFTPYKSYLFLKT